MASVMSGVTIRPCRPFPSRGSAGASLEGGTERTALLGRPLLVLRHRLAHAVRITIPRLRDPHRLTPDVDVEIGDRALLVERPEAIDDLGLWEVESGRAQRPQP